MTNKRKIINDPVYGFLTISNDLIFDVISHPFFQRERRIKQLGFTDIVYPGANHTRFAHMLGAMSLMTRALDVLRTKGVPVTDDEYLGAQLAILLHDVGHGPFSHTSEHTIVDVHHEDLSLLFMRRMNEQFGGRLATAIAIFEDSYPKRFLHQLVSSQLDMDRLDYLARDSFFTGVSEGIVGTDRIISMLNVYNDKLVVDEKGVYSIEKFIISRRLMYWQVYLHKTVLAADNLLLALLSRAKELLAGGASLPGPDYLIDFLSHRYTMEDFNRAPDLLDRFALLDDSDITSSIKSWQRHSDIVLSDLACRLVNRQLPAIRVAGAPFDQSILNDYRARFAAQCHLPWAASHYFVGQGVLRNHAYDFDDPEIFVLFKDGRCVDISEASDQLDRHFLEKQVTKYYLFFPKELR